MAALNAAVLVGACIVTILVVSPRKLHSFAAGEALVLAAALALVVVINLILLRRALGPLQALAAVARRVDLTRPGQRVDWLPHPERFRWVLVDFQDARMCSLDRLLRYLLVSLDMPAPDPCGLDAFMDIVSQHLRTPTVILMDELTAGLAAPERAQAIGPVHVAGRVACDVVEGVVAHGEGPEEATGGDEHEDAEDVDRALGDPRPLTLVERQGREHLERYIRYRRTTCCFAEGEVVLHGPR